MGPDHRRSRSILFGAAVTAIVGAALTLGMFSSLAAAAHPLTVARAELDRGRLRIEGTAHPNTMIFVDGDEASEESDDKGRFRIEESEYEAPACVVEVSDGVTSLQVPLDRCVVATEPPPGDVAPAPEFPEGSFLALEIFAPVALEVPAPLHPSPFHDQTAVPAGLPPTALALFVMPGAVVTGVDGDGHEWRVQVGDQEFFVYASEDTVIEGAPRQGDVVKIVALRTLEPGPIVAEVIRLRTTPVDEASVVFLYSGTVETVGEGVWTVDGIDFTILNDPDADLVTDIDPAELGEGDEVTIEFGVAPIAP